MKIKRKSGKRLASIILTLALLASGITLFPSEAYAAGWLEYAKTITLGTAVSGSIKTGDYYGKTELSFMSYYSSDVYWHIYSFTMPKDGLLSIYLESLSEEYWKYYNSGSSSSSC